MTMTARGAHIGTDAVIAAQAVAWANNDIILVAWSYPGKIPLCIGFTLERKRVGDKDAAFAALPSYVGWEGGKNDAWESRTTDEWPLQRFNWKDLVAQAGQTYVYRIVPLTGKVDAPQRMDARYWLTTGAVARQDATGGAIRATFNRGILATQTLARKLHKPNGKGLTKGQIETFVKEQVAQLDAAERLRLTGELLQTLLDFASRALRKGRIVAALYELTDDQLLGALLRLPKNRLQLILSNGNDSIADGETASGKPKRELIYDGLNSNGRHVLGNKHGENIVTRYMPSVGIAHNKFLIYIDADDVPQAVLTGSTNWTCTGLCTQNNNAVVIEDRQVAQRYLDYWTALKADTVARRVPDPPAPQTGLQAAALRGFGGTPATPLPIDGARVTVWFAPNTPARINTGSKASPKTPATPPDMALVAGLMAEAKQAVFFLAFQPGSATSDTSFTFLDQLATVAKNKPALLIRGAVSDARLAQKFNKAIYDEPGWQNAAAVAPAGFATDFGYFETELVKTGHAIIHDKIIVIDPFATDGSCHVVTGSHNLGFKASYNNDENMLIVSGNRDLAIAYAVHAMDVHDHYRWRYKLAQSREREAKRAQARGEATPKFKNLADYKPRWTGLFRDTDAWQDKYFEQNWENFTERLFWVAAGAPLPPLLPSTSAAGKKLTPPAVKAARRAASAQK